MAFQLAEAYVELSQRGFSSVGGRIDGIGRSLTKMMGFATLAAGAIGGLAGVASAGGLVKLAADAETVQVQFETMLGSAEAAVSMVERLRDFSASTPFQFEGLAASAKQLLAFGVSADQALPTLRVMGDIAAVTGNRLEELVPIYGKVKAQGKLTAETINQFSERAIPLVSELAKQFGVTESKIREMASEGKIGFGDVQRALQAITSEGGMAFEGMAKQSATLAGLWSTLKDNITLFLTDIGTAIVEAFDLKSSVGSLTDLVQVWRSSVLPQFKNGLAFIVGLWNELSAALGPPIRELMFFGKEFAGTQLNALQRGLRIAVEILKTWGPVVISLVNVVFAWWTAMQRMVDWFLGAIAPFIGGVASINQSLTGFLTEVIQGLADVILNWDLSWRIAWETTKLTFSNMWERISTFFRNVIEFGGWMLSNWGTIFGDMVNMATTAFQNIGDNLRSLWDGIVDYIAGREPQFNWKPMLDGFKASVMELPNLSKPAIQQTNAELDRLYAELAKRKAKQLGLAGSGDASANAAGASAIAKFTPEAGGAAGAGAAKTAVDRDKLAVTSIVGLADKMQQAAADKSKEAAQMKMAERQANAAEKLADRADGEGVKVRVIDMVNQNRQPMVAFG